MHLLNAAGIASARNISGKGIALDVHKNSSDDYDSHTKDLSAFAWILLVLYRNLMAESIPFVGFYPKSTKKDTGIAPVSEKSGQKPLNRGQQFWNLQWLCQIPIHAGIQSGPAVFFKGVGRHGQNGDTGFGRVI